MIPFPLHLESLLGKAGMYGVFLLIGFLFGYVLEISGFNHSPTLAAQFYFKNLRVFKVFFTAIVVCMLLIFGSSALGLLDYNLIWVNPTYLWSGILGGLIMGVGFILGGFCPGTSLVALATLKIDGIFFVLGGLVGVFTFSETVGYFSYFWNQAGAYGRLTLMDVFNLPAGVLVVLVTLMALGMLWGGEQLEKIYGGRDPRQAPQARYWGAGILAAASLVIALLGQPTTADRWKMLASTEGPKLETGQYDIHPGELLDTLHDHKLNLIMIDVRSESDYNLFHLLDARHIPAPEISDHVDEFISQPANTVFVVMSNDEMVSTEAWKTLTAQSVPNVYILKGGINRWLTTFSTEFEESYCGEVKTASTGELRYEFNAALGSNCPAAYPDQEKYELEYIPRIELELKRAPVGGGCG
mgnify:CR=1 FL=1